MNTTTLISVQSTALSNTQTEGAQVIFRSTCFGGIPLSQQGATYIPTIQSFKTISKYVDVKHLINSQYFGQSADNSKLTMSHVKASSLVDLSLLVLDSRDALLNIVTKWIKEDTEEAKQRAKSLVERGLARVSFKQTIEPVRKELFAIIASYPEVIDVIKASEEFSHVDAIRYGAYIEGELVELITVFSDQHIMYTSSESDAIVASVSGGFKGEVLLPSSIVSVDRKQRLIAPQQPDNRPRKTA